MTLGHSSSMNALGHSPQLETEPTKGEQDLEESGIGIPLTKENTEEM